MMKRHLSVLVATLLALALCASWLGRALAGRSMLSYGPGDATVRISVSSDGTQGSEGSSDPDISADGRYVTFSSYANNLVPGDTNEARDVFLHDRQTGQTTRISVASDGTQGDGDSGWPAISADGRYVAFNSIATNLLPGLNNNGLDFSSIFVHDRETGQTTLVSMASDGTPANEYSGNADISADGRYVVFESIANNLVPGDNPNDMDIFVHDRLTGTTTIVSVNSDGIKGNGNSNGQAISADGRYVVFSSEATNLVPGDTNLWRDVFIHDRVTGETSIISIAFDGTVANGGSLSHSISADGRHVSFASEASNLVPDDINSIQDVFVYDRQAGEMSLVSVASDGTQTDGGASGGFLSANGRFVAFSSHADDLVPGDTNNVRDVFVHDRITGQTTRVSLALDGAEANEESGGEMISADGRYVVFESVADNLVPGDTNQQDDIFVRDLTDNPGLPFRTFLPAVQN